MQLEFKKKTERRRGPDLLIKWVRWTAIIGWMLIIVALSIVAMAKPDEPNVFNKYFDIPVETEWDQNLLKWSFYMMFILFLLCFIAFLVNLTRLKRKTDKISKTIVILGLASLIGMIIYIM